MISILFNIHKYIISKYKRETIRFPALICNKLKLINFDQSPREMLTIQCL